MQLRSTLRCGRGPGKNLQEKIKVKKKFIEEQKTALAKVERMKSANALGQNLRAASVPRFGE